MGLSVKGGLVRCGRCGRRYSNPFAHVCAGQRKGRTRVKPKFSASVKCPRCGKAYANPLIHVCASKRGDFKRRKKAFEKRQKAAARRTRPKHNYRTCRDPDCERVACEAYRQGVEDGMDAAREEA